MPDDADAAAGQWDRDESGADAELEGARRRVAPGGGLEPVEQVRIGNRAVQRGPVVEEPGPRLAVRVGPHRVAVGEGMFPGVGHRQVTLTYAARSCPVVRG